MDKKNEKYFEEIGKLLRFDILTSTTEAGSGHPTSSLSAVELLTTLFFGGFLRYDFNNPKNIFNDRFILSKGHAAPLLYSLYHVLGLIDYNELLTLRKFGSKLQGHPVPGLPLVDVATGSLGHGLSVGVGMALGIRLKIKSKKLNINQQQMPKVWVLLGDSEMAEGQIWEAMDIAAYYKLNNLTAIIDVNRLGQSTETQEGWDIYRYEKKVRAFGWDAIIVDDGHSLKEINNAFTKASERNLLSQRGPLRQPQGKPYPESEKNLFHPQSSDSQKPKMIIAKTVKGKGISFLENINGWHGKVLNKEELKLALKELGKVDLKVRGKIKKPGLEYETSNPQSNPNQKIYKVLERLERFNSHNAQVTGVATREAYGDALVELGEKNPDIVVLDAEVANSTFQNKFQKKFPDRFFEMFIAEENMMGVALGLSKMGYIPFISTFAAFLTQILDQARMSQYSQGNVKIVGSHAGVSTGQDGSSQMGLEDLSMFRSILQSTIFYPSDATSSEALTKLMVGIPGIVYLRTTRSRTPIIYDESEKFEIGGMKVHRLNKSLNTKKTKEEVLIISAGITLHEALKAQEELYKNKVEATVVDLYCIKPVSKELFKLIRQHRKVIIVEDHYPSGGIGEAVLTLLATNHQPLTTNYTHLCVRKIPVSGTAEELLRYEEIDVKAIMKTALSR
ncbi:transketolase family protein [Patescibacteria group bacterium]|nr:transketolase family protein [Patescibacteria group bacterium]